MRARWLAAGVALATLAAGCASGGTMTTPPAPGGSSSATPASTPPGTTTPTASPPPASSPGASVPAARWQAILDDLQKRGAPADAVEVVSAKAVTWNDGSLGCPTPGRFYTQALVPGLQVVVRSGGTDYDYRFGRGDRPKLCEQ